MHALALAVVFVALPAEPAPLAQARALEKASDPKGAVALLDAAAAAATDPFLRGRFQYEAARTADERLHDPLGAAKRYGDYVAAFPTGPYASLARDRQRYLVQNAGDVPEALAEYEDSLRAFSRGEVVSSLHRVEALVLRYKTFPLRARACFWLSNALRQRGDLAGAERWLGVVMRDEPGSEDARRADLAVAGLRQQTHDYGEAIATYERYLDSPDPLARELARAQLAFSIEGRRWRRLYFAGLLVLAVAILALLAGVWRRRAPLWPLPFEVWLFLPVLLLFTPLAFYEDRSRVVGGGQVGFVVLAIGLGASIVATLNGAYLRAAAPRGALRLLYLALAIASVASIAYCAIYGLDLMDLVVTTLEQGADR